MNKIILFSRPGLGLRQDEIREIFAALTESGFQWAVNDAFADEASSAAGVEIPHAKRYAAIDTRLADGAVMLSYGGDGTFLEAVRLTYGHGIPVLGINYGHLGFLANTPREGMQEVFALLHERKYRIQPRTMLRLEGGETIVDGHPYALNEFTIHRTELNMTYVDVFVDGEKLTTYRGDGVLLSTPTGSTAYALSVGGPIVAPMCECFVIAPIAPHNLTMRPMVIPDSSVVTFRVNSRAPYSSISLDNRSFDIPSGSELTVRKAEEPVFLVNLQNISFYDTLRNKMMWGLDSWESRK